MNRLISTLGKQKPPTKHSPSSSQSSLTSSTHKSKHNGSIWLLDGQHDLLQSDNNHDVNVKFNQIVKCMVEKKFDNQKYYLDEVEEVFEEIINQLCCHLEDVPSQLTKLIRIQSAIVHISDSYLGEIKNHLKNFQSLLDVRIRKLKRKEKRTDLSQFDKILHDNKQLMKKKHEVMYIDEDRDQKKYMKQKVKNGKVFQGESKKSYGTMNSGSNENQSGSGRKSAGSQSRSSQGNALAVLLSNREIKKKQDQKIQNINKTTVNESYDFSAIMCSSVAVRQRADKKTQQNKQQIERYHNDTVHHHHQNKVKKKQSASDEKDQAFIFHRPKKGKKLNE